MACLFNHQWKRYVAYKLHMKAGSDDVGYYQSFEHNGPNNEYRLCLKCQKLEHSPRTAIFWGATYSPPQPFNNAVALYRSEHPTLVFLPEGRGLFPDNTSDDPEQNKAWQAKVQLTAQKKRETMELFSARLEVSMLEKGHHPFIRPNRENLKKARIRYQALVQKYGRK